MAPKFIACLQWSQTNRCVGGDIDDDAKRTEYLTMDGGSEASHTFTPQKEWGTYNISASGCLMSVSFAESCERSSWKNDEGMESEVENEMMERRRESQS